MTAVKLTSCRGEQQLTSTPNLRLSFSTDTVAFDTLFTDVSSATHTFLVYNHNKEDLCIMHAGLAGGTDSPYRVNMDGLEGSSLADLSIRSGDSMYVFVEVTIDARGQDELFEVYDSLCFTLENGVTQQVFLTACGQEATVLRGAVIDSDMRFTAQRPYLIYDSLHVKQGVTLTIAPGTRLFFSDKAEMQIHGCIEAIGTADSIIVFRGARTDLMFDYLPYDRLSAQWGGITLHESSNNNIFKHCDIHSGTYGLRAQSKNTEQQKITMYSSQIHNVNSDALQLTQCKGTFGNSLFSNAGGHCVNILGGQIDFLHCTMANFFPWKSERGTAVNLSNQEEKEENIIYPLNGVNFINCIITGSKEEELSLSINTNTENKQEHSQYQFTHSVINSRKESFAPEEQYFSHIVWEHKDSTAYGSSNFLTIDHDNFIYDFHLDSISVARGIASSEYLDILPYDKDEQQRTAGSIDAGCFQYVEHVEKKK
jgi:hypothetical protein